MIDPVAVDDLLITAVSSAAVIVFGGLYAGLFACARLWGRPWMMPAAFLGYGLTAAAVLVLAQAAHLDGAWMPLVAAMLVGYLLAPYGIWQLCTATHDTGDDLAQGSPDNQPTTVDHRSRMHR